jgi:hypothetical protein
LLAHAWLTDQDCSVPGDPKKLLKYCNAREMSPNVLAKFPVIEDANDPQVGRRRNHRQYGDWLTAKGKVDKAAMAGRKSGAARNQKMNERSTNNRTENEQTLNERSTDVELKEKKRKEQNTPTPTPTAPQTGAVTAGAEEGGVCVSKSSTMTPEQAMEDLLTNVPRELKSAIWLRADKDAGILHDKVTMRNLLAEYGSLAVGGAAFQWWQYQDPETKTWYWRNFLDAAPAYLANGKAAKTAADEAHRRDEMSPGYAERVAKAAMDAYQENAYTVPSPEALAKQDAEWAEGERLNAEFDTMEKEPLAGIH